MSSTRNDGDGENESLEVEPEQSVNGTTVISSSVSSSSSSVEKGEKAVNSPQTDSPLPTTIETMRSVATPTRPPAVSNKPASFWRQLMVMMRRNTILQFRYRNSTLAQVLFGPLLFLLLLFVLQKVDSAKQLQSDYTPDQWILPGISQCQGPLPNDPCINIMFTPDIPETRQILSFVATRNKIREPLTNLKFESAFSATDLATKPTSKMGLVPVPNSSFLYNYTLQNPNTTAFGLEFTFVPAANGRPRNAQYQTWFNFTNSANQTDPFGDSILSLTRAVDEAILAVANGADVNPIENVEEFTVRLKDWPIVPPTSASDDVVSLLGAMFFFCSMMITFICVLNQIVTEKELHLRHSMQMMGLWTIVYWVSLWISNAILVLISSLVICGFGIVFDFTVFTNSNFLVLWITFYLFGLSMVTMAFFITTLVKTSRTAILIGIFIFIIGLLFESMVFSNPYVGYIWYDQDTNPWIHRIFSIFPFFNFGKIFLDISIFSTGRMDLLTNTFIPGPGFQWSNLYEPIPDRLTPTYDDARTRHPDVPPPIYSWYWMLMNIGLYGLLTLYFDQVLPDEYGNRQQIWFFLNPKCYGLNHLFSKKWSVSEWIQRQESLKLKREATYKKSQVLETTDGFEDEPDVAKERLVALDPTHDTTARICNLRKEFRTSFWRRTKNDKVAVKDLCLTLPEGKLLALLGQNGAGKSTTMNMLSGLTKSTGGDALFYGLSMDSDMTEIRSMMGVCPQHDILFDDLTAKEHIELYAGLKNVPKETIAILTEERLQAVRLWKVKDRLSHTYSGGMKRRLSMIISTLGDPKIIFLDEPTTGMDPHNRRHVWSFIEQFKQNRIIVLTTHSMEEADVLADRICVMAHGRLRAIGNPIHLKNKFGAGYRITLVTLPQHTEAVKKVIESKVPGCILKDDSAGALIYQFPASAMSCIPQLVKWLEEVDGGSRSGSGISMRNSRQVSERSTPSTLQTLLQPTGSITTLEGAGFSETKCLNISDLERDSSGGGQHNEEEGQDLVQGWSISMTNLEEVFLRLIREVDEKMKGLTVEQRRLA